MRLAVSCTVVSLFQWNLACHILMTLLLNAYIICHLTLVVFLHYLTLHKNPRSYVFFLSLVLMALKRSGFGVSELLKWLWKEPVVWLDHSRCSKWRPFAFTHAHSMVCYWSMASSMIPWGIRSQVSMSLCFISSMSIFCVMSGSAET